VETLNKKLILKIFRVKSKSLFNIHNQKLLIDYFAAKNLTPSALFFNHKYALLEYIEGNPLDGMSADFPKIIKEIHTAKLNVRARNFYKTANVYLKKIPVEYLNSEMIRQIPTLFNIINKFPQDIALCHNDLNPNNFVQSINKLYILDFEYASINDKYFDFASIKTFLNENNFKDFTQKYDIILNSEKLHAYGCLLDLLSSLWCFMMNYPTMGKQSAEQMLNKIKDLN
jgi:thiamine kinase-like enzyme